MIVAHCVTRYGEESPPKEKPGYDADEAGPEDGLFEPANHISGLFATKIGDDEKASGYQPGGQYN